MSKFIVDLSDQTKPQGVRAAPLAGYDPPKKRGRRRKVLLITGGILTALMIIGGTAGYFYWQNLRRTPQYSLALLIDAARRNDQKTIDQVVDTNAVVDDFLPQVTNKAIELYGRGLPPQSIARVAQVAAPVMPAVKERAREELPGMIREKSEKFASIPFWAMAMGAGQYLDVRIEGDIAYVKSLIPERQLEVIMRRNGERWQIVGIKDDELATKIAQKVGQNIIAIANKGGVNAAGEKLGIKNLQDMLNQAQDLLDQ
jgi:hypothetical protein